MWAAQGQGIGAGPESQFLSHNCVRHRRSLPCSAARPRRRFVDPWALSAAFPLGCLPSDLGTGVGLAAPLLQIFAKGLGQAPVPVFGFCSSPLGDAGPARIFPPAHKPRLPQMRDGGMVRGAPSGVKGACPAHAGCGMVGARKPWCRRSSGVEHALGKGGVECSIHSGGTSQSRRIQPLGERSLGLPNMQTNAERGGNMHRYVRRGCGRKSLFVHTEKRRPRHWRSRRKSLVHKFTHALCTSFSGSLQGLNGHCHINRIYCEIALTR